MQRPKAHELDAFFRALAAYNEGRRTRDRPERFIVFPAAPDLAHFIHQNVVAAWAIRHFARTYAVAVFRALPGHRFVVDCNPAIRSAMETEADAPMVMPLDWLEVSLNPDHRCPVPQWYELMLNEPDHVLLPSMLDREAATIRGLAENPPVFRLPDDLAPRLAAELAGRGLVPDRWHAVLDAGAETAEAVRLVTERGGRAVLAGPAGSPVSADAVDLRGDESLLPIQAAAVAGARCVLAGEGTTLALASAFRVPACGLGLSRPGPWLWNRGDSTAPPARMAEALNRLLNRPRISVAAAAPPETLVYPFPEREGTLLEGLNPAP
jgi:hypothetical protein